jgi:hypothetical protein
MEVNTTNDGQQSNLQEQSKGQQHMASEEETQTDFLYINKDNEATIHEEVNKLKKCNPNDQKGSEDEKILYDGTKIHMMGTRISISEISYTQGFPFIRLPTQNSI